MQNLRLEIGRDIYYKLVDKPKAEVRKYIEDNLIDDSIRFGYGYYGSSLPIHDNDTDEYYVLIKTGGSCN